MIAPFIVVVGVGKEDSIVCHPSGMNLSSSSKAPCGHVHAIP